MAKVMFQEKWLGKLGQRYKWKTWAEVGSKMAWQEGVFHDQKIGATHSA
jgi:hypothetical protein